MASEVSKRLQAGPDEFKAMYGELIREQRRLAKAHQAIVVTGARRVCVVKAEPSDAARGKRQIDATCPAGGPGQEDERFCVCDAPRSADPDDRDAARAA
jgi:hypothetical protein